MKKNIFILALLISIFSFGKLSAQFTATPCTAGPLPNSCTSNTITLTTSMSTHTVPNPVVSNGTGCFSVGSDITAGTIYDYEGWFTSTVAADGTVDVYAAIITGDPVIGIYSGTCGALVFRACDDDSGTGLDAHSTASGLTPGATVWIRVWDYNGGTGQYQVTTNGGTPPVNNLCASATGLTANAAPIAGTNYCATVSAGDPADCQEAGNTNNNVWYSFVVPTAPSTVTVNYSGVSCFGSGAGITAGVYSGTCGSFSNLVCRGVSDGSTGSSTFTATAPGTYYVMIDGDFSGGATSLCNFNIDVDIVGCAANAGVNNEPATQNICANTNYTLTVAGNTYTNTNVGTNPCLGWGFWVKSDPLGAFPAVTTYSPPSGGLPTNDANYMGVFTSLAYPLANGSPATLPAEGNGATYYIAPVTLSNCQIGEVNSACVDVGNYTEVTMIPAIDFSYAIDCDVRATPTTKIALTIAGGQPSITASSFTLTNTGGVGTLSSTTVANNGTVNITGIPNNGTVTITVVDGAGCSRVFTVGPIVASDYCPSCSANAGSTLITQVGDGVTELNNGTNVTTPFVLCYGDQITLNTSGYTLPASCNSSVPSGGGGACAPQLMYAILNDYSLAANPVDDNTFTGVGSGGPIRTFTNNGSYIQNLQTNFGLMFTNNTLVLYPFTADHTNAQYWWPDSNNDDCIDAGAPIKITFLNEIKAPLTQTCNGPSFVLTGGYPEFFPGTFGVVNNGAGTLSSSTINHGGTLTITGLTNGQAYSFSVIDNNGCPKTFTGTYNYTAPTLAIVGLGSSFCLGDAPDPFTATPIGTSTTYTASSTGGVTIQFLSDGYCNEWSWYIANASGTVVAAGNYFSNSTLCSVPQGTNLAPVVVNNLDLLNGPYTFYVRDRFGDGQGGATNGSGDNGSTTITNNNGGAVLGSVSGNWGTTTSISLSGLTAAPANIVTYTVTSTGTLTGTDVTQTGNVSGSFAPNTVGTQTVTYTYNDGLNCVFTQTQNVVVNQVPALSTPTNPVICAGQTITLSTYNPIDANGTTGVGVWHLGNTPAGAVVTTVTPTNGQQYCYEWTANGNCRDNKVITVTVNPLPTATASSNTPCAGSALNLTGGANGMTTYAWSGPSSYSSSSQSPTVSATATAGMAGTYTLVVTDANGCQRTATTTVTVNALPNATASGNTPCVGTALNLTGGANGMTSYTWTGPNTYSSTSQSPTVSATATAGMAGTYTLNVSNGTCTNTATVAVTVNTLPSATASANTPCVGAVLNLTGGANGMSSYSWSGPNTYSSASQSPTVSASATAGMAGTYTLAVSNGTCSNTATVAVTVNALPTATASSNAPCVGTPLNLTGGANGMTTYNWSGPNAYSSTSQNPTVSASATAGMAGTYTLNVSNGTCSRTATVAVTVNALPNATASSNTPCVGTPLNLTGGANGMTSYSWAGPIAYANGTQSPSVSATATAGMAGTYTLTVSNGTCTNTATVAVTVNALPSVTASSNTPCIGTPLNLIGGTNGLTSYTWTGPSAFGSASQSPTVSATATAGMAGTYTLNVSNGTCTNTATVAVTVNALPSATAASNSPVCIGSPLTLTGGANGMTSYTWSGPGAYANGTQSPTVSATATAGMAGTYTVSIINANGCQSTATTSVAINSLPSAVGTSTAVCSGTLMPTMNFVTTPATGVTIDWANSNPAIGLGATGSGLQINGYTSPIVGAIQSGTITYTATISATNCSFTGTAATLVVNPNPVVSGAPASVFNPTTCGGSNGHIDNHIVTGGTGALTYNWTPGNPTGDGTASISGLNSVPWTATVTDVNGCSVTTNFTLTDPSSPPAPAFTPSSATVCLGGSVTLDITTTNPGDTYNWSGSGGYSATGSSVTVTPSTAGTYTYNVSTTAAGCNGSANPAAAATVTVYANPTAQVSNTVFNFCEQSSLVLQSNSLGGGALTVTSQQWYNSSGPIAGATGTTYTVTTPGTYSLQVTNNQGCSNTNAITAIAFFPEPALSTAPPTITPSNCTIPTGGISGITLTGGTTNYTYTWSGTGVGLPISSTTASTNAPSLTNQPAGTYTLTISDGNGCNDTTLTLTINNVGAPASPLATVNNSNCAGSPMSPITVNDAVNTINWYSDAGLTTFVGTGNPFTPVTTTTHTLYVTSTGSGCSSAATTVTVTVNPKPVAPASLGNAYCAGQTINDLTVTSAIGGTVAWYSDVALTTQVGTGTPFATGISNTVPGTTTYYVAETALGCLGNYTQVDVTVNANPLIDSTNMVIDTASCDGSANGGLLNISVTGTGPLTYVWTGATGVVSTSGASPDLTPFPAGTYTLTVTDGNTPACSAILSNLEINAFNQPATPVLNLTASDLLYCDGETVTALTATSTNQIYWYSDATLTTQVGVGSTFTPIGLTADATYYVVADNNGCVSASLPVSIDFHATPIVPTVNDAVYCRGDAVADLVATGTSISWFADNTTTINIGTGSPFASGVSNAGVTTIWYTDSISYTGITCGSDTGSVTITINNLPVLDITTGLVVNPASCGATSTDGSITGVTVISGTPGFTYTWSNATGVVSTSITNADLLNQAVGSYTLVVTDGNTPACSATSSAININTFSNPANPVFVTSSDTVYCDGETVSALQANASAGSLVWYSDATLLNQIGTGSPFTPTGITSSTTIYLVANNNNCNSDSIPVSITFNQLPTISANSPSVCDGGQVTLAGTNGSGNATTYAWDNGITDGVAFTPTLPGGSYIVTGTDNVTNCVNTFTTTVTVVNTPTVSATVGSSASVCSGGTITLTGTGASTYSWSGGVIDGVAFTPPGVASYTVTGTDAATTCTNTFVVNVSIESPPTVNTGVTATIPCGSTSSVITGVTTDATTPVYTWSGPNVVADGNTATPTLGAAGQYTLTVVDNATGCTSSATLDITNDAVVAAFTPDLLTGFAPLPVTFSNQSTGATSYTWNFGDGQTASTTTLASVVNTFAGIGTYTVTLTAVSNSCSSTATVTIVVDANSSIIIPNIFSPNGDNVNDVLTITSTGLSEMNIDIFNRWGSKVYVIDRPGQNWDGKLTNGESAAEGTYFYILKAKGFDKKEYEAQGPIMLVK